MTFAAVIMTGPGWGRNTYQICSELVIGVNARQLRQHEDGLPLEDFVFVVEQADEEIEMGIEQVRALFADEAEGFGAAVFDAGLFGLQALGDVREQARMLDRLAGERFGFKAAW